MAEQLGRMQNGGKWEDFHLCTCVREERLGSRHTQEHVYKLKSIHLHCADDVSIP